MFSRSVIRFNKNVQKVRSFHSSARSNSATFQLNPVIAQQYKAITNLIADWKAASSTDLKVPTIDWAHWEKTIKNKKAVAELKAEYEATKFDATAVTEEEIKAKNAFYDTQIEAAKKRVQRNAARTKEAEGRLEKYKFFEADVENQGIADYYELIPGIEEEMRQQYWDGHYTADEHERKNETYDAAAVLDFFNKGGRVTELPRSLLPPALPQKLGDFDFAAEVKKCAAQDALDNPGLQTEPYKMPEFREPKDHHPLLPLLAKKNAGAPVFGAPVPGEEEGHH